MPEVNNIKNDSDLRLEFERERKRKPKIREGKEKRMLGNIMGIIEKDT